MKTIFTLFLLTLFSLTLYAQDYPTEDYYEDGYEETQKLDHDTRMRLYEETLQSTQDLNELFPKTEKLQAALEEFSETDFMVQFDKKREEAESLVEKFLDKQDLYTREEVRKVAKSYDRTAFEFNKVLARIERDFVDKKTRKYIEKMSDSYAKGLKADFTDLERFYDQHYLQTYLDVTGDDIDGSLLIPLIIELISITNKVTVMVANMKAQQRKLSKEFMYAAFYYPHRFKNWLEIVEDYNTYIGGAKRQDSNNIDNSQDDYYQPSEYNEDYYEEETPNMDEYQETDPLEQEIDEDENPNTIAPKYPSGDQYNKRDKTP